MAFYQSLKHDRRTYPPGRAAPGQAGWIADRLLRLRALLNGQITARRRPDSLIIGSWNIRHFDGGRPRLHESFHYIAEIIDHFDICAVQEVKNIEAVDRLMRLLGPNWTYFINDSSGAGRGNHERMAFLYNRNRVSFRHLVGELVLPRDALPGGEQIARTPFFAAFQAGWFRFTLCSAHIIFKEEAGRPLREDEIRVIAEEMAKRAKAQDEVHVFLGDMNIDDRAAPGMRALLDAGFDVPDLGPTSLSGDKYYDQIAFVGPDQKTRMLERGVLRWPDAVFRDEEVGDYEQIARLMRGAEDQAEVARLLVEDPDGGEPYANWARSYSSWRTHEMSDHLPVWIELEVDYSNEYLRGISDPA
ncbi:endonuclease/exonuclease/phosphatase family protein [Ferrimonas balearica]|nr:endonuclease/exonuclease/phosphatase family protein [Ferrimonas balearica]